MTRPIYAITSDILADMKAQYSSAVVASKGKRVPQPREKFAYAMPYINAALNLDKIEERYFEDSGKSVVAYMLSNLTTYRGETAKALKAELKEMIK